MKMHSGLKKSSSSMENKIYKHDKKKDWGAR